LGWIPSGTGFFVVLLVVGVWGTVVRRHDQRQPVADASPQADVRSYPTVIGRIEISLVGIVGR